MHVSDREILPRHPVWGASSHPNSHEVEPIPYKSDTGAFIDPEELKLSSLVIVIISNLLLQVRSTGLGLIIA